MKRTSASLSDRPPTPPTSSDPWPAAPVVELPLSEMEVQQMRQDALMARDVPRLTRALMVRPEQDWHLNLKDDWRAGHVSTLVEALPADGGGPAIGLEGQFPDSIHPDLVAALLTHPGLHTLGLEWVSLTSEQLDHVTAAAQRGTSRLQKLYCSNSAFHIFDPGLARLIQCFGNLQTLALDIRLPDIDVVHRDAQDQIPLATVLQTQALEQLTLSGFNVHLAALARQWQAGPPPPWRAVTLRHIDVTVDLAEDSVEGLAGMLCCCIDNPHLRMLELGQVYMDQDTSLLSHHLPSIWHSHNRKIWMAKVATSLRQRSSPLGIALTANGALSMQFLLCALTGTWLDRQPANLLMTSPPPGQTVRCVHELTLRLHTHPSMPETVPTSDPTDATGTPRLWLARLAAAQLPAFSHLGALALELLSQNPDSDSPPVSDSDSDSDESARKGDADSAPPAPGQPVAAPALLTAERQALVGLSDVLGRLQLTLLRFEGPGFDPLPDELQTCARLTEQRCAHLIRQRDAALFCFDWTGPGRTLPSELASIIMNSPDDLGASLRLAARIPVLHSASLIRLVERYNIQGTPLHPLTALARSVQERLAQVRVAPVDTALLPTENITFE